MSAMNRLLPPSLAVTELLLKAGYLTPQQAEVGDVGRASREYCPHCGEALYVKEQVKHGQCFACQDMDDEALRDVWQLGGIARDRPGRVRLLRRMVPR